MINMRSEYDRPIPPEVMEMNNAFPVGCSDTCRLMGNICRGLEKNSPEILRALAERKHWRKADKAVVFGYQPGGCFDFILARDFERMMTPESIWIRGNIPGTNLWVAYDHENSVEVYGTVLSFGQVMIYALDEKGNYRDIITEELPALYDYIVNNYAKIIFHGDLIEAMVV